MTMHRRAWTRALAVAPLLLCLAPLLLPARRGDGQDLGSLLSPAKALEGSREARGNRELPEVSRARAQGHGREMSRLPPAGRREDRCEEGGPPRRQGGLRRVPRRACRRRRRAAALRPEDVRPQEGDGVRPRRTACPDRGKVRELPQGPIVPHDAAGLRVLPRRCAQGPVRTRLRELPHDSDALQGRDKDFRPFQGGVPADRRASSREVRNVPQDPGLPGRPIRRLQRLPQDPHEKPLGVCASCHTTESFKTARRIDHEKTGFPLVGKHATVPCATCHVKPPTQVHLKAGKCADCHQDPHKGVFKGADCASCHNESGFAKASPFDHAARAHYALEGGHASVPCASCHKGAVVPAGTPLSRVVVDFRGAKQDCASCHRDPQWASSARTVRVATRSGRSGWPRSSIRSSQSSSPEAHHGSLREVPQAAGGGSRRRASGTPLQGSVDRVRHLPQGPSSRTTGPDLPELPHAAGVEDPRLQAPGKGHGSLLRRQARNAAVRGVPQGEDGSVPGGGGHGDRFQGHVLAVRELPQGCSQRHPRDPLRVVPQPRDLEERFARVPQEHHLPARGPAPEHARAHRVISTASSREPPIAASTATGSGTETTSTRRGSGTSAANCHRPTSWTAVTWNHAQATGFVLGGAPRDAAVSGVSWREHLYRPVPGLLLVPPEELRSYSEPGPRRGGILDDVRDLPQADGYVLDSSELQSRFDLPAGGPACDAAVRRLSQEQRLQGHGERLLSAATWQLRRPRIPNHVGGRLPDNLRELPQADRRNVDSGDVQPHALTFPLVGDPMRRCHAPPATRTTSTRARPRNCSGATRPDYDADRRTRTTWPPASRPPARPATSRPTRRGRQARFNHTRHDLPADRGARDAAMRDLPHEQRLQGHGARLLRLPQARLRRRPRTRTTSAAGFPTTCETCHKSIGRDVEPGRASTTLPRHSRSSGCMRRSHARRAT